MMKGPILQGVAVLIHTSCLEFITIIAEIRPFNVKKDGNVDSK